MVPELAAYQEAALIARVAAQKRIRDEEAQQLAYDEFMSTLALIHHQARWQYEYNQFINRSGIV
ncbi:hypothetical protein [Spirosoma aerophilum]